MHDGHQRRVRDAGLQQRVVAHGPDFGGVQRDGVAAVDAMRDGAETQPVATEAQAHDLLAAVAGQADQLEEAGVQDVQVLESVAGAVDHVASVHDAALRFQRRGDQLQGLGNALTGAVACHLPGADDGRGAGVEGGGGARRGEGLHGVLRGAFDGGHAREGLPMDEQCGTSLGSAA